ncbi:glycosyl hydrolase family 16 [Kineococcus xinjiangensis]|uniref:Glycosyl hydrolase family 16 n=1 Tax=Kineococcus xinjiangensis TaxID=512762 RepID=A0A2S6IM19_9ACTN|nr:malectin domain-containing carbohydrate-binding protein [Kineococcus xinjiangensis]PPK95221.1 glycosyl hydrolase family 16 [Kineococcus xinjiangensis]
MRLLGFFTTAVATTVATSCLIVQPVAATTSTSGPIALNAGGGAVTASGVAYSADAFNLGGWGSTATLPTGTTDAAVHSKVRVGSSGYSVPVTNGTYHVTLQTVENYWTEAGKRVFDVNLEGKQVLAAFDPFAAAGGKGVPINRTFEVSVADGKLDLGLKAIVNNTIVSGLVIAPYTPAPTTGSTEDVNSTIAVNTGGGFTTTSGITYMADSYGNGGRNATAAVPAGTTDFEVYSKIRVGSTGYTVPVTNGTYEVRFQTLENYWSAPGKRVFDVSLEGKPVLTAFDPFVAAGAKNTPITRTFEVGVTDGWLNLGLHSRIDSTVIAGLVVIPKVAAGTAPAPSTFKLQSFEGFDSTLNDTMWWRYGGVATASGSPYASSGVSVTGGNLVLTSRKGTDGVWRGAGVGHRVNQTYGRWTMRARAEKGRGITMVALLWPTAGGWPPEIDFAEDNGGDRDMMSATAHFADHTRKHSETAIDSTQWHDYAVEWTPGQIKYLIDGKVWAAVADSRVPSQAMRLGIQSEAWVKGTNWIYPIDATTPSQVRIYVDSVKVETFLG